MSEKLHIIRTVEELLSLQFYLADKDLITVDTETTGVNIGCQIIGLSVCAEEDVAYYLVLAEWNKQTQSLDVISYGEEVEELLYRLRGRKLIMHNAIFDCRVIFDNYKVQLIQDVFADTMIMAHLADEEGPKGLKELGTALFGEDATKEQEAMKASVIANGGVWQDGKGSNKEMYKADSELLARYGAKDAILTYNLFQVLCGKLIDENLTDFFFNDESMPLLRGTTYDLNTVGLKVDIPRLKNYEKEITHEIERLKAELTEDLSSYTKEREEFSITSNQDLAWLLFVKLGYMFDTLTPGGKTLAKSLVGRVPYNDSAKRKFINEINAAKRVLESHLSLEEENSMPKLKDLKARKTATKRAHKKTPTPVLKSSIEALEKEIDAIETRFKYIKSQINKMRPEKYLQVDKYVLEGLMGKAPWIQTLLKLNTEETILTTYVQGIQQRVHYGNIYPRFNQTGTTSGRYSSSDPNFQNLPRTDKRVKSCIIARPGEVFVGADYSQLEPRVFASLSKDERLIKCFADGDDFYSVVGAPIFGISDCTFKKDGTPNSFAEKYPELRDASKVVALATPYGTQAFQMSSEMKKKAKQNRSSKECQEIIDNYFFKYPSVEKLMLGAHETAKTRGVVYSLFGRPRRLPDALQIARMYKKIKHGDLPRDARNILNLAMNHPIQSTGASIVNRACIRFNEEVRFKALTDAGWKDVKIVLQVHDEVVVKSPEALGEEVRVLLKDCMENTTLLPGVALIAEPKIAYNLADLK
jgi:DNA polymerase I-like protein with 3'-5' exonuclease and polymerase domains